MTLYGQVHILSLKQYAVCIKQWCSQYYSMDANLGRLMKRWRKQIKAFENKSHRRLLNITYRGHKMNIYIKEKIKSYVEKFTPLL